LQPYLKLIFSAAATKSASATEEAYCGRGMCIALWSGAGGVKEVWRGMRRGRRKEHCKIQ